MTETVTSDRESPTVRAEDGHIAPEFLAEITEALEAADRAALSALVAPLHEADLADVLEALKTEQRHLMVQLLGPEFDFLALTEVDDAVRDEILELLPTAAVAEGVRDLDTDDAIHILEDLEERERTDILARIPATERATLRRSLEYPEETAGRRMQSEFIAVPPFWTVGQTIDYMRESDDLPDDFYEIFIIDPAFRPLGTVSLNHLLRTKRPVEMQAIMEPEIYTVDATDDQEEVARTFERYDLVSAAVIDESGRLVGVITVDDIIDVIEEEADEDIRLLGGVGDEEISDSVLTTTRSRFIWLLINLGTAILASGVISLFDATIEQMVALAVLMPIVASMGGNAGTQTMTVAVRAIATGDLARFNVRRIITRETLVGFVNGCLFAVIMGAIAGLWFGNAELGGVIGVAMVVNLVAAGLSGILIPIVLNRLTLDPALASAVFVTTITDVVGFFAFLGLAAWWFGLV
ncbi:MAG TPA: magnesium transporter [Hyphomicrobiales bacterium]|nr:magnesium transporter [Hyphomicrobiales bacterium]